MTVTMLEAMLEEWRRGEFWNPDPYAEDVVFVVSGPDAAEYHGLEGLTAGWRDFLSVWEDLKIDHDGIVPSGEGHYVLLLRLRGRGRGSGIEIDAEAANVVLVRDGRIARLEIFWDRDAALRAAGGSGA